MIDTFDAAEVARKTAVLAERLQALEWVTDSRVGRPSQDFYWFSPLAACKQLLQVEGADMKASVQRAAGARS